MTSIKHIVGFLMGKKRLYGQIMEFLDDRKYCTGNRNAHKEWLLEFASRIRAKDARQITYKDVCAFTDFVFKQESSEFYRTEAAKVLRKFFRYCVIKRYMAHFPEPLKEIKESDKMETINRIIGKIMANSATQRKPNVPFIQRVRELHDKKKKSFQQIAEIFEKETGKKHYREYMHRLYWHKGV